MATTANKVSTGLFLIALIAMLIVIIGTMAIVFGSENASLHSNTDDIVFCGSDYCVMESGNILHCGFLSNGITYCPNEED